MVFSVRDISSKFKIHPDHVDHLISSIGQATSNDSIIDISNDIINFSTANSIEEAYDLLIKLIKESEDFGLKSTKYCAKIGVNLLLSIAKTYNHGCDRDLTNLEGALKFENNKLFEISKCILTPNEVISNIPKNPESDLKLIFLNDKVILKHNQSSRVVGQCRRIFKKVIINLGREYLDKLPSSYEEATSCIYPKTKSSSASMSLHQTISINIMRNASSLYNFEFEESFGTYRPDLTVRDKSNKIIMLIDICGRDTNSKINQIDYDRGSHIKHYPIAVINKYEMIDCCEHKLDNLILLSSMTDNKSSAFIKQMIDRHCQQYGNESRISERTISFFLTGVDENGRSIAEHSHFANIEFNKILMDKQDKVNIDEKEEELSTKFKLYKKTISRLIFSLKDKLYRYSEGKDLIKNNRIYLPENKYFIYPKKPGLQEIELDCDFEKDEADMIENPEVQFERIKNHYHLSDSTEEKERMSKQYATKIDYCKLRAEAILHASSYDSKSFKKDLNQLQVFDIIVKHFKENGMIQNISDINYISRLVNRGKLRIRNGEIYIPMRVIDPTSKMIEGRLYVETQYFSSSSIYYNERLKMDPDHKIILKKYKCPITFSILSRSRYYHELRVKAKVAEFIVNNPKPMGCYEIKHHKDSMKTVNILIRGLAMKKDRGVVYVSYLYNGAIYKQEKWSLADVEGFSISHVRLLCVIMSMEMRYKNVGLKQETIIILLNKMHRIYGAIIKDNSWGLSRLLKPFRYLCQSLCMLSDTMTGALDKFIEALEEDEWKHSLHEILATLIINNSNNNQINYLGKTPLFGLEFKDLANEIFLVNMCPSRTIGSRRHTKKCVEELIKEVELFNQNKDQISNLFNEFDKLLGQRNLNFAYRNYFKKIDELSALTGGRFTNSPASIVLLNKTLERVSMKNASTYQDSLPKLSSLLTSKASSDESDNPNMAAQTISELMMKHNTSSTSQLFYKLLLDEDNLHMSMRMFDKDQVGGDREISIMNNKMRIMLAITEYFFRRVNDNLDNEYLHKRTKYRDFVVKTKVAANQDAKLTLSIDQTRWGPNHYTNIFGLLCLSLSRFSTEGYLASLPCFFGQEKIFEIPIWIHELLGSVDSRAGNLLGIRGEYHMGQGIYHATSSCFHALFTKHYLELVKGNIEKDINGIFEVTSSSMVTSDDVTMFIGFDTQSARFENRIKRNTNQSLTFDEFNIYNIRNNEPSSRYKNQLLKIITKHTSSYSKILKYFGIKTSTYKNVKSTEYAEFNSIYSCTSGIVKSDAKFCYTLVQPQSCGVMINDYSSAINKYFDALNSGTSDEAAISIAICQYLIFLRQWKMNMSRVGFPSKKTLERGLQPIMNVYQGNEEKNPFIDMYKIQNKCMLKFNTRNLMEKLKRSFDNLPDCLEKHIAKSNIERIAGSRECEQFRSCKTFYKGPATTDSASVDLKKMGLIGYSFEAIVKSLNNDPNSIKCLLDERAQIPYYVTSEQRNVEYKDMFTCILRRQVQNFSDKIWDVLISSNEKICSVNRDSTDDEIRYHMLRKHHLGQPNKILEKIFDAKDSLITKFIKISNCEEKMAGSSSLSVTTMDPYYKTVIDRKIEEGNDEVRSTQISFLSVLITPPYVRRLINPHKTFLSCINEINYDLGDYKSGQSFMGSVELKGNRFYSKTINIGDNSFNEEKRLTEMIDINLNNCSECIGQNFKESNEIYMKEVYGDRKLYVTLEVPSHMQMPRERSADPPLDNDDEVNESKEEMRYDINNIDELMDKLIGDEIQFDVNACRGIMDRTEVMLNNDEKEFKNIHGGDNDINQKMISASEDLNPDGTLSNVDPFSSNKGKIDSRTIKVEIAPSMSAVCGSYFTKMCYLNKILLEGIRINTIIYQGKDDLEGYYADRFRSNPEEFYVMDPEFGNKASKLFEFLLENNQDNDLIGSEEYADYLFAMISDASVFNNSQYLYSNCMIVNNNYIGFYYEPKGIEVSMDVFVDKYYEIVEHQKAIRDNSKINLD